MKVLLIGGHATPLLATIAELKKRQEVTIQVVSRRYATEGNKVPSVESQILRQENIPLDFITTGRLQRHLTIHTIPSVLKIPIGFLQAFLICVKQKPDVIVSFGGYLAVPVCFAGFLLRIPIVIHEQSTQSGLANSITAIFAKKICISWESSRKRFPSKKTVYTGNPVRSEIFGVAAKSDTIRKFLEQSSLPLIYITGGNQGSHAINKIIFSCLPKLLEKYRVLHQTGNANSQDLSFSQSLIENVPQESRTRYLSAAYIDSGDIGAVLHTASIIISRAGANTVAEVIALGKPGIFIPLPWAQKNEQRENAKIVSTVLAGIVLEQKDLTPNTLLSAIAQIHEQYAVYQQNMRAIRTLAPENAAFEIANQIMHVVEKNA